MPKNRANARASTAIREKRFIAHYSVHFNGAAAVRFAGYETPHAAQYAMELLAKKHIQAAVNKAVGDLGELHFRLSDELVSALKSMMVALDDPTRVFAADGTVLPADQWPEDLRGTVRGFEVEESTTKIDEKVSTTTRLKKIRFESRSAVIGALAKVSGNIIDRTQFVDKEGNPTNPPAAAVPVISITVGQIAVPPAEAEARRPKRSNR